MNLSDALNYIRSMIRPREDVLDAPPTNTMKLLHPRWSVLVDDCFDLLCRNGDVVEIGWSFIPSLKYNGVQISFDYLEIERLFWNDDIRALDKIPVKAFKDAWYYYHAI